MRIGEDILKPALGINSLTKRAKRPNDRGPS
jgi:hypothetical protein